MHTTISSTETGEVVFNHNGDFSGDVRIVTDAGELWVPFSALKELVATYVRAKAIRKLERATDDAVLGL